MRGGDRRELIAIRRPDGEATELYLPARHPDHGQDGGEVSTSLPRIFSGCSRHAALLNCHADLIGCT